MNTTATDIRIFESQLDPAHAVMDQRHPPGEPILFEVKRGQTLRIVDLEGNQAADVLFYNRHDPAEHYSATTTMQRQGGIYLTTGTRLISTRGSALLTITADTCGRHDTLGGACACESNMVRYAIEKRSMHACRDSFWRALRERGPWWEKRDIANNINFFMNVPVTPQGGLTFADGISAPGRYVEMHAEMDVLAVISNCPQLNNPCNGYDPTPVRLLIWK